MCQEKFMTYVRSHPKDPFRTLFAELTEENFIYLGFKHLESDECTDDDRNRLLTFMHEKYKNIQPRSFNFEELELNSLPVESFFRSCAKSQPKAEVGGWHFMVVKHAVVCGHVHLFINEAYERARAKAKQAESQINKSSPDVKVENPDCKAGKFSKIMWALKQVYHDFDVDALRGILLSHRSLALHSMLKKLGSIYKDFVPIIVNVFRFVLIDDEDFTAAFDNIYATAKDDTVICNAIIERFKNSKPPLRKVNTSEFFKMVINCRTMKNLEDLCNKSLDDLIRNPRQSVKEITNLSHADEKEIAEKVKTKLDADPVLRQWYDCAESFV
jgi:hypothetical protein